jgi:hypothetical protein
MTIFKPWLALCCVLILPVRAFPCEMQRIGAMEAITCGVGSNLQEARSDAIRQGIDYLVGSYVTSDLEFSHEQIIKDSVTDYSGAITDRFEIIQQGQRNDGLYEMTAHIWINRDANRQKNRAPSQTPATFDGQSLQAEAISRIEQETSVRDLWEDLLRGFPGRAFDYVIDSSKIDTLSNKTTEVQLTFSTVSYWRSDFLTEFYSLLKSTGREALAMPDRWRQSLICLQVGFTHKKEAECYIIDVPHELLQNMLCMHSSRYGIKPEFGVSFETSGQRAVNIDAYHAENNEIGKSLSSYIEFNNGGFDFYIVDNDMINNDPDYQSRITDEWYARVSIEDLAAIEKLGAMANKCFNSSN